MFGNRLPASRTTHETSSERPPKYNTAGRGPGVRGVISQPHRRVPSFARNTTGRVRWPLLRGLLTSGTMVGLNTSRRWFAATAAVSPSHNTLANPAIPAAIFFDVFMASVYLVGRDRSVRHVAMHCSMNVGRRGSVLFATQGRGSAGVR